MPTNAFPTDPTGATAASATATRVDLDAKLHQGYDPDATHKHQGVLLSSVQYITQPMFQKIQDYAANAGEFADQGRVASPRGSDFLGIAPSPAEGAGRGNTAARALDFALPDTSGQVVNIEAASPFAPAQALSDGTLAPSPAAYSNGANAAVAGAARSAGFPAASAASAGNGGSGGGNGSGDASPDAVNTAPDTTAPGTTTPAPVNANPSNPTPSDPTPTNPTPTNPTPVDPTPPVDVPPVDVPPVDVPPVDVPPVDVPPVDVPPVDVPPVDVPPVDVPPVDVPPVDVPPVDVPPVDVPPVDVPPVDVPPVDVPPVDVPPVDVPPVDVPPVDVPPVDVPPVDVPPVDVPPVDVPPVDVPPVDVPPVDVPPVDVPPVDVPPVDVPPVDVPPVDVPPVDVPPVDVPPVDVPPVDVPPVDVPPVDVPPVDVPPVDVPPVDVPPVDVPPVDLPPIDLPPVNPTPIDPTPPQAITPPQIIAGAIEAWEDLSFALPIQVIASVQAHVETRVIIGNVPSAVTLSAGIRNDDGSWTLTIDQLTNLTATTTPDWNGTFDLQIAAVSMGTNSSVRTDIILPVHVNNVADAPTLMVQAGIGHEDTPIALTIELPQIDSQTQLQVTISNLPNGATLSAGVQNGDGSWTLTAAQLEGVTLTPPAHWSGSLALGIAATATENGTSATAHAVLPVTITGDASAPILNVGALPGVENEPVALNIDAQLLDTDGSESLTIQVDGLPVGASLSAGIRNSDGSWTLNPSELAGLSLVLPEHTSGDFTLQISAIAAENGQAATTTSNLSVHVEGVASTPSLSAQAAIGIENAGIPIRIDAALADTDGSEQLSVAISGVPVGGSFSAGVKQADGSWSFSAGELANLVYYPPLNSKGDTQLTVSATASENDTEATIVTSLPVHVSGIAHAPLVQVSAALGSEDSPVALTIGATQPVIDADESLSVRIDGVPIGAILSAGVPQSNGSWLLTPADLADLTLNPPADFSGTVALTVTAIARENGTEASQSAQLLVTIAPVADAPAITLQPALGLEDSIIPLTITVDAGRDAVSVTIGNLPSGASLSAGVQNGDGSWTVSPAQLPGLTLTPPANFNGALQLSVVATSTDGNSTATTTAQLPITIGAAADAPLLVVAPAAGIEDQPIALTVAANAIDASEQLSVVISGVPNGASLSAGTNNGDGSWTLTQAQLAGLTFTAPANASGTFGLTVTAITQDGGSVAVTSAPLSVVVAGVADAPQLTVQPSVGIENGLLALHIGATLGDTDGSENLTVTVAGLPAGATLSAGTRNADGSWTVAAAELEGLTLTPPHSASGDFQLRITATASESASSATVSADLPVSIAGVANTPLLVVAPAIGLEDQAIALAITTASIDLDGSEQVAVTIHGVPADASLSAGVKNNDGSWSLTPAQLAGLTLTPPANYSGSFTLTVTSTATEQQSSASISGSLPVVIAPVADAPALSVQAAAGLEDSAIALTIGAALGDLDGSENLSITLGGVPAGATLSAGVKNANGSWTIAPEQLTGLTITPPANYSGSFNLVVVATASDGLSVETRSAVVPVTVAGVADVPSVAVQAATGAEDRAIPLSIQAALNDSSETMAITISGVPVGAVLSAGIPTGACSWTLTPAQLAGLTLTPPANSDADFTLTVTATSFDGTSTASSTASLPVTVTGVADAPALVLVPAVGLEDTAIPLAIGATLTDLDGSETLAVTVSGMPAGASLSAGTRNADGSWSVTPAQLAGLTITPPANFNGSFDVTITATASEGGTIAATSGTMRVAVAGVADVPSLVTRAVTALEDTPVLLDIRAALVDAGNAESLSLSIQGVPAGATLSAGIKNSDGSWSVTPAQLSGLVLMPPANYSGTINLSVTATASENGTVSSTVASLPVTITGIADAPSLQVQAASGAEDTAIALNITCALIDLDGSESLSVTVSGLPVGATLSAGTRNADGSYTLTPAQLSGLKLTPATNSNADFILTVTATAQESSGHSAVVSAALPVTVHGVADAPSLSLQNTSGAEDTAIALAINPALVDNDGSESLSIRISGVPSGASLSAGIRNFDGSYSLTPAQLSGLKLTPPANFSGTIDLAVTATSSEGLSTATTSGSLRVSVTGVADAPNLTVTPATGKEDNAIALLIDSSLRDGDGSEMLGVTISGVPAGAALSAGTRNSDGSWSVTPAQLSNLTLTPPANYNGNFTLTVTAQASEAGTVATRVASLPVHVLPVADAPSVTAQAASGAEDGTIALNISAALPASDLANGALSLVISNVPAGAQLSAGHYIGGNRWSLTPAELTGLTLTPPANYSGTVTLGVTAINTQANSVSATSTTNLAVTVTPVADAPVLNLQSVSGKEDSFIPLNIRAALGDADGSEMLSVKITGVPTGATLSAGTRNSDGSWSVTPAQLSGLGFKQALNSDADAVLTVTATSTESNGAIATTSKTLAVNVEAVADVPTVSASNASGAAGAQVGITIGGAATDASETVTYLIQGVPDGFALNQGLNNGDNSWTLTQAQLSGLKLISPPSFNGQLTLYASAVSHDNDNAVQVSAPASFKVSLGTGAGGYLVDLGLGLNIGGIGIGARVGVGPELELFPASGALLGVGGIKVREDSTLLLNDAPSLLNLSALNGLTGLIAKIVFSGVPTGASFSAGTNKGGGVWEFAPTQLTGLSLTPAPNSDGDYNLTISAKLLNLVSVALISTPVTVIGVADVPTLTVNAAAGSEDTAAALNISGALTDTDGSESISFLVSGMPSGFALNRGINNGNGSWSLTSGELSGLTVIPPANYSGAAILTVSAIATEREGDQTVRQQTVAMNFAPVADAPIIATPRLSGQEDVAIPLVAGLGLSVGDSDGSESLSSLTISGLPTGASITHATNNGDGSWTVNALQLGNAALVPPAHWNGDATFSVTARTVELGNGQQSSLTQNVNLHIDAAADAPSLTVSNAHGTQGEAIELHLGGGLVDADGSEKYSLVIAGVPDGSMLSAGVNNGDGSWTLTQGQLSNLTITPPDTFSGDMQLTATAYSMEGSNASTASVQQSFHVQVDSAANALLNVAFALNTLSALAESNWLGVTAADSTSLHAADASVTADAGAATATQNLFAPSDTDMTSGSGSEYDHAFQQHAS